MLIATLPPVHQEKLLREIVAHPSVAAVRYNTGVDSAFSPDETVRRILEVTRAFKKPLYIDLKGKQLRITEWSVPPYGPILLNHKIKADLPAEVVFRGDDRCELKKIVGGCRIYVDPSPRHAVGKGQSINILAKNLEIKERLSENDPLYIKAAVDQGVNLFMFSFIESSEDVLSFEKVIREFGGSPDAPGSELVLKIESQRGIDFIRKTKFCRGGNYRLMAARDDLMIQIGGLDMPKALALIAKKDPDAICASRLLQGLEQSGEVTMGDIADLQYMRRLGYRDFMLSDGVSRNHFAKAIEFWKKYATLYLK